MKKYDVDVCYYEPKKETFSFWAADEQQAREIGILRFRESVRGSEAIDITEVVCRPKT